MRQGANGRHISRQDPNAASGQEPRQNHQQYRQDDSPPPQRETRVPGLPAKFASPMVPPTSASRYMGALGEMVGPPKEIRDAKLSKEMNYRAQLQQDIEERARRKAEETRMVEDEKRRELEEIVATSRSQPAKRRNVQFQKGLLESPDMPMSTPRSIGDSQRSPARGSHNPNSPYQSPVEAWPSSSPQHGGQSNIHNLLNHNNQQSYQHKQAYQNQNGYNKNDGNSPGKYNNNQSSSKYHRQDEPPYQEQNNNNKYYETPPSGAYQKPREYAQGQQQPRYTNNANSGSNYNDSKGRGYGGNGRDQGPGGGVNYDRSNNNSNDTVPRAQFDEVNTLCRELIEEQKELHRKLEERERLIFELRRGGAAVSTGGTSGPGLRRQSSTGSEQGTRKAAGARTATVVVKKNVPPRPGFGSSVSRSVVEGIPQQGRGLPAQKSAAGRGLPRKSSASGSEISSAVRGGVQRSTLREAGNAYNNQNSSNSNVVSSGAVVGGARGIHALLKGTGTSYNNANNNHADSNQHEDWVEGGGNSRGELGGKSTWLGGPQGRM